MISELQIWGYRCFRLGKFVFGRFGDGVIGIYIIACGVYFISVII